MVEQVLLAAEIKQQLLKLQEISNETAFFANMAKNSISVPVGENEILTRIFTGQLMFVDRRDISVSPHLIMSGGWEMEITQLFRHFIKEDSVVFDVGANTGYFGIIAGSEMKNGRLHFFEANSHLVPLLKKSLWVNGLMGKSKINSNAVSSSDGEKVYLNVVEDLWGSSSLHEITPTVNVTEKLEVETISLDNYVEKNQIEKVDVVKIDVEGHEENVIKGMGKTIESNPQLKIFLEYTLNAYSAEFFPLLKSSFDSIFAIKGDEVIPVENEEEITQISNEWVMLLLKNDVE